LKSVGKKGKGKFRTISLPGRLVEEVEKIVDELEYCPRKLILCGKRFLRSWRSTRRELNVSRNRVRRRYRRRM